MIESFQFLQQPGKGRLRLHITSSCPGNELSNVHPPVGSQVCASAVASENAFIPVIFRIDIFLFPPGNKSASPQKRNFRSPIKWVPNGGDAKGASGVGYREKRILLPSTQPTLAESTWPNPPEHISSTTIRLLLILRAESIPCAQLKSIDTHE